MMIRFTQSKACTETAVFSWDLKHLEGHKS